MALEQYTNIKFTVPYLDTQLTYFGQVVDNNAGHYEVLTLMPDFQGGERMITTHVPETRVSVDPDNKFMNQQTRYHLQKEAEYINKLGDALVEKIRMTEDIEIVKFLENLGYDNIDDPHSTLLEALMKHEISKILIQ